MLPAPNLDDRRFQDLVDDARRLVQQRCPGWNDHNVSDPGITLLETFAMMVDQLIYRLNRVPERNYVKFLELIGVQMRPPTAARGRATFWLSAPQPQAVLVRAETEVATPRTDIADPIVFSTIENLNIVPCSLSHAAAAPADGVLKEFTDSLGGAGFACFQPSPVVGDALMIGLSNAVPSGAVVIRLDCRVSGVGVDPRNPPLAWEAWNGTGWSACDVDRDETGGLNKPGDVVVHLPDTHTESTVGGVHAGWVRCRLIATEPGQRSYTAPPQITNVSAFTMGATTRIVHAEAVHDEEIGISDGAPGQRFELQRRPVVPWEEPASLQGDGRRRSGHLDAGRPVRRGRPGRPGLRGRPGRGRGPVRSSGPAGRRRPSRTSAPSRPRARTCDCRSTAPAGATAAMLRPARSG